MQPIPIDRGPPVPFPQMTVRSRREVDNRDAINAYAFEHWQTDGKYGINDRRDLNSQVPFYDMAPNMARTDRRNLRDAPRFVVGSGQGGSGRDMSNPYFEKYDLPGDPRNVARELQGAVYETRDDRGAAESQKLLARNFSSRYEFGAAAASEVERRVQAEIAMKPVRDDITLVYRNTAEASKADRLPGGVSQYTLRR